MDFLRQQLDRVGKHFEKGGRWEPLYAFWEMQDTILYTPGEVTKGPSHVRDGLDLKRMMITVVVALLPLCAWACYNTGYQSFAALGQGAQPMHDDLRVMLWEWLGWGYDSSNVLTSTLFGSLFFLPAFLVIGALGGVVEGGFAVIRKHEINEGFLVTWFLFALTLPPTIPLWQVVLGIVFGLVIGKEVFGGTGMNILNPALTARAFLFFAYPAEISGELVWTVAQADPTAAGPDAWSGATYLARAAVDGLPALDAAACTSALEAGTNLSFSCPSPDLLQHAFIGYIPGSMGETSTLLCLVGAGMLIFTKIGSWRTMAGVALGTVVMAQVLNLVGSETNAMFGVPFWWHMVLGGWALGTVFMATDPVSSAFTDLGKWIYGALIGVLVVLIRVVNPAYPEGMMLAILFMNMFAPLIDHYVVKANIKRRSVRYGQG
jgi:Na+-transporting NADH:ubiquinone oxidoreductase subunit B